MCVRITVKSLTFVSSFCGIKSSDLQTQTNINKLSKHQTTLGKSFINHTLPYMSRNRRTSKQYYAKTQKQILLLGNSQTFVKALSEGSSKNFFWESNVISFLYLVFTTFSKKYFFLPFTSTAWIFCTFGPKITDFYLPVGTMSNAFHSLILQNVLETTPP